MLRVLSGPLAGATFEVGPRVLIGRVAACDVHLADVEVSREHAMIVTHDGQPTLVDLDSRNGTFMAGKRVRRVPLRAGDTFAVAGSEFIYDRAAPISTTSVLSTQFGVSASGPSPVSDELEGHPTQETASAKPTKAELPAVEERETQRAIAAVKEAPVTASAPEALPRPTVQLEAATAAPKAEEKATVQIRAVQPPTPRAIEAAARATASLAAIDPRAEQVLPAAPPSFEPPPLPPKAAGKPRVSPPKKGASGAYEGDLFADITAYRSFRFQLQRGEMPSGEEVAAMIDLEAELREPPETDTRRDVVTKRFFRRFPLAASLQARFTTSGRMINAEGKMTDLSADGLQCSLELGGFSPKPEQLAMLVIEHTRDGVDVRYSVTARVVWSHKRVTGFVFAGVPSWSERRSEFDDVETAVRARPKSP
ncbi:MAG: FHA domain-containing protein [Nannocystaceae bacterium]|nr:FHA domain-containing protein [Nannocystaceae bacterium]